MGDKGPSGHFHGTTGDRTDGGQHRIVFGATTRLDKDSQGKHIRGHKNFQAGKSVLDGTMEHAQTLADTYGGTGQQLGRQTKERVDFGREIGTYVDRDTGERLRTTIGIIHYSRKKDACHIVPAAPKERG